MLGGAFGSVLRYLLKESLVFSAFPLNTLLINCIGCLALGIVLTVIYEFVEVDAVYRIGIATGLIGAFTTFSTVCKELYFMLANKNFIDFCAYLGLTIIMGLFFVFSGFFITRAFLGHFIKANLYNELEEKDEELQ